MPSRSATAKPQAFSGHGAVGRPTHSVTLGLTDRICMAELSSVRCVHITVPDKQQFYWVHFDLLDAGQLHNLEGGGVRTWAYPHSTDTHTQARRPLRPERHAHRRTHTRDTLRYLREEECRQSVSTPCTHRSRPIRGLQGLSPTPSPKNLP